MKILGENLENTNKLFQQGEQLFCVKNRSFNCLKTIKEKETENL